VAWTVKQSGVDPGDPAAVAALLPSIHLAVEREPAAPRVFVNGQDVSQEIRTADISRLASIVSAIPAVREWLLPIQRQMGLSTGIVVEGRDIGTCVFPTAQVKFFLDADVDVRAARRQLELTTAGHATPFERTRRDLELRDTRDRSRERSPLRPAADAHVIDTSMLEAHQVVDRMLAIIASRP
jgi:cytidylate kinase